VPSNWSFSNHSRGEACSPIGTQLLVNPGDKV
jgi:hypothetical protein